MRDRNYILPLFVVAMTFVLLLFVLGRIGALQFFSTITQKTFYPLMQLSHRQSSDKAGQSLLTQADQTEKMQQLIADNKALRDQFETSLPPATQLLPVDVVGMPGAIPNVSFPESLITTGGGKNGVQVGDSVVVKNQLVGIVTAVTSEYSQVRLVSSKGSSFSIKDSATGAIGVAKGQGSGEILVDTVALSDTLHIGDLIVSLGSQNVHGNGVMPDVVLGKIVSIDKNPSNLFQTARVVPLVAFDRLTTVFIAK